MVMGGGKMRPISAAPSSELWDRDRRIEQFVGLRRGFDEDVYWFDSCYSKAIQFVSLAALGG
jgi:hypothetical protein